MYAAPLVPAALAIAAPLSTSNRPHQYRDALTCAAGLANLGQEAWGVYPMPPLPPSLAAVCYSTCPSKNFKSQHHEDLVLLPLLLEVAKHSSHGTFVELGALDGEFLSNTFALESCFKWRGLLIEADEANFNKLKKSVRRVPRAHAAVCDATTGTIPILSQIGKMWGSGVTQSMTQEHLERFRLNEGAATINLVPCKPLDVLMRAASLPRSDFLSLDVEGEELSVLQNANLSTLNVILVETDGDSPTREAAVRELLLRADFWLAYELRLGPQKGGGFGDVFVRGNLQVPDLEAAMRATANETTNNDSANIRFRTASDASPQRFVSRFCKDMDCEDPKCTTRHTCHRRADV